MKHLPNVDSLVRAVNARVSEDALQVKEAGAAESSVTAKLVTPVARELLKFAKLLRQEAEQPVTIADVQAFAGKIMEQQNV